MTFGAPFGALTSKRGGALALRASSSVIVGGLGSGTGRTVRSICCAANQNGSMIEMATSDRITGEFFCCISDFMVVVAFAFFHSRNIWFPFVFHPTASSQLLR